METVTMTPPPNGSGIVLTVGANGTVVADNVETVTQTTMGKPPQSAGSQAQPAPFVPGASSATGGYAGGGVGGKQPEAVNAETPKDHGSLLWASNGVVDCPYPQGSASLHHVTGVVGGKCAFALGTIAPTLQRWAATFALAEDGGADPYAGMAISTNPDGSNPIASIDKTTTPRLVCDVGVAGPYGYPVLPTGVALYLVPDIGYLPNGQMKLQIQAHDAGTVGT